MTLLNIRTEIREAAFPRMIKLTFKQKISRDQGMLGTNVY